MSSRAPGGLFIVSAPSGGGKTSLTRGVVKPLARIGIPAEISVSYTTRAPRPGERRGVHYHFIRPAQFEAMANRGEFLEHAEIYGQRYGTGRAKTEASRARGRDVILDIDWQGAHQIKAQVPDAIAIYILPPSMARLEQRLRKRGQDSRKAIARRLAVAREEMAHYVEYDYVIVNDHFERALAELMAIFAAHRALLSGQQMRHKALIKKLLR